MWLEYAGKGLAAGAVGLVSLVAGGLWSGLRSPSGRTRSIAQHVAAGTVFTGLAVDVFARVLEAPLHLVSLIVGLSLGLAAMLTIRIVGHRAEQQGESKGKSLGITIVADVITDGGLMGLSIVTGAATAYLFVGALVPEMVLLGMTVSEELAGEDAGLARRLRLTALIGAGIAIGGALGATARLAPAGLVTAIEAFGAIALAYTIFEELLRESHEREENPWIAATFFAAFIPLFVLGVWLKS